MVPIYPEFLLLGLKNHILFYQYIYIDKIEKKKIKEYKREGKFLYISVLRYYKSNGRKGWIQSKKRRKFFGPGMKSNAIQDESTIKKEIE